MGDTSFSSDQPDLDWEKYKEMGGLSHNRMSPETKGELRDIKLDFEKTINELKVDHIAPLKTQITNLQIELKNKVSFKIFTWVLSILMAIVVGWMGLIWTTLQDLTSKTVQMSTNVSLIQYRLDRFEIIK